MSEKVILEVGVSGEDKINKLAEAKVKATEALKKLNAELRTLQKELSTATADSQEYATLLTSNAAKEIEVAAAKLRNTQATKELSAATRQAAVDSGQINSINSAISTSFNTLIGTLYAYNNTLDSTERNQLDVVNAFTAYVAASKSAGQAMGEFAADTNAANQANQSLAANANAAAASTTAAGNSADKASTDYVEFTKVMGVASAALDKYALESNDLMNRMNALSEAMMLGGDAGRKATIEYGMLSDQLDEMNNTLDKTLESAGRVAGSVGSMPKEVVNSAKGFKQGSNQMQSFNQILRETPNFAIDARIGIMSLSNNIMPFISEIENAKKAGQSWGSVLKTLGTSFLGLQGIMLLITVALTAFSNPKFVKWFDDITGSIFGMGKAAKDVVNDVDVLHKSMLDGGGVYKTANEELAKTKATLEAAKKGFVDSKDAVKVYNDTLGDMFGKATSVDGALALIISKQDAYVIAMREMAFANAFFTASAEDMVKIVNTQTKSQQEILRDAGQDGKALFEQYQAYAKETAEVKARLDKARSEGQDTFYIEKLYKSRLSNQRIQAQKIADIENTERNRQITDINKHQKKLEGEAIKHFNNANEIAKNANIDLYKDEEVKNKKIIELRNIPLIEMRKLAQSTTKEYLKITKSINIKLPKFTDTGINDMIAYTIKSYQAGELSFKEYQDALTQYLLNANKARVQITIENADLIAAIEEEQRQKTLQNIQDSLGSISEISDAIASIYDTRMTLTDQYYDAEEARINNSVMTEEAKNAALAKLDQERYEALKKDFERKKQFEEASAWINFAAGSVGIWSGVNAKTGVLGIITAGVQQAALLATTIASVAQIRSQKLDAPQAVSGGTSAGSTATSIALNPTQTALTSKEENLNMMNKSNMKNAPTSVVKVSDIDKVQNKVSVRDNNLSY